MDSTELKRLINSAPVIEPEPRKDPYAEHVDAVAAMAARGVEFWRTHAELIQGTLERLGAVSRRLRVSSWDPRARRLLRAVGSLELDLSKALIMVRSDVLWWRVWLDQWRGIGQQTYIDNYTKWHLANVMSRSR